MQGKVLGSRYRIIEYIAKGGFGKTYLAEDIQLPNKGRCVVKQLYPSVDDSNFVRVARRLFQTEANTLNTLGNHDRIPQLLAYFEQDEKFYLVQQYIEGHTLSQELISGQPWSEVKAIELLKDCLNILDYIHAKGVIHRDIKPDNLIRRRSDNKLVLVDFGTVKEVIAEQTQLIPATVAVGTRGYMPTEQARGKPRTTSDIYALGVIAIQALTGIHPIQLDENDEGEIVWQEQADCSARLKAIIGQMTRYHFKERQQHASEIIAALDSLISQQKRAGVKPTVEYTSARQNEAKLVNSANSARTQHNSSLVVQNSSAVALPSALVSNPAEESDYNLRPPIDKSNISKSKKTGKIAVGITTIIGAIAIGGIYLLNQRSSQTARISFEQQIDELNQMLADRDYRGCYDKAVGMKAASSQNQAAMSEQQQLEANCGLELAKQEAGNLKYAEALAIAKTLPQNTNLNTDIQQEIKNWSAQLLDRATKLYKQEGRLEDAIALVEQIPENSALASQATNARSDWRAEAERNATSIKTAEQALSEEKWRYAKQQATKVQNSDSTYWQEQAKTIIGQADEALDEIAEQAVPQAPPAEAVAPTSIPKTPAVTTPDKVEPNPPKPESETPAATTPDKVEPNPPKPESEAPAATTPDEIEPAKPNSDTADQPEPESEATPEPQPETPTVTTPDEVKPVEPTPNSIESEKSVETAPETQPEVNPDSETLRDLSGDNDTLPGMPNSPSQSADAPLREI